MPTAKAMLEKWKIPMPNQSLSDEEIRQYLAYFKWADQNLQPKGTGAAAAFGARNRVAAVADPFGHADAGSPRSASHESARRSPSPPRGVLALAPVRRLRRLRRGQGGGDLRPRRCPTGDLCRGG